MLAIGNIADVYKPEYRMKFLYNCEITDAEYNEFYKFIGGTSDEALYRFHSVSAPLTMACGIEAGQLLPGQRAALLGIGSGINSLMLGVEW